MTVGAVVKMKIPDYFVQVTYEEFIPYIKNTKLLIETDSIDAMVLFFKRHKVTKDIIYYVNEYTIDTEDGIRGKKAYYIRACVKSKVV